HARPWTCATPPRNRGMRLTNQKRKNLIFGRAFELLGSVVGGAVLYFGADGFDLFRCNRAGFVVEVISNIRHNRCNILGLLVLITGHLVADSQHCAARKGLATYFDRALSTFRNDADKATRPLSRDPVGVDERRASIGGISDTSIHVAHGAVIV